MHDGMNQVHPQLYISNITAARTESKDGIDTVVSVCQDSVEDNIGCEYFHYNMSDGPDNKYGGDHTYEMFSKAAERILSTLREGKTVLVHCHAGRSRSASTSIAALAVYCGKDYDQMYKEVEQSRPQINPDEILEGHARKFIAEK